MKSILLSFCVLFSVGLFAQVPSYVPQYGLLGYYPFTGNPNDVSANAANLTNNNAVLTADRFGAANSAYSFNGINQNLINSSTRGDSSIKLIFLPYSWVKNKLYKFL
jgi:hypothetical protein